MVAIAMIFCADDGLVWRLYLMWLRWPNIMSSAVGWGANSANLRTTGFEVGSARLSVHGCMKGVGSM